MVNVHEAQYFAYEFENNLPRSTTQELERYAPWLALPFLNIYAFSEEEARTKFKNKFDVEAGTLLDRMPW